MGLGDRMLRSLERFLRRCVRRLRAHLRLPPIELPISVLVVEDEKEIAALMAYLFEAEGFAVECVYDGTTGLSRTRSLEPDILVLGLVMPGLSGLQVVRAVRADQSLRQPKIMFATGAGAIKPEALHAGADVFFAKPFPPREFLASAKELVGA